MSFPRGSTPTNTIYTDISLVGATVYITYEQNGVICVEKSGDDVTITDEYVRVRLTQEETLRFQSNCDHVSIQIRYVREDGTADASNIMKTTVKKILHEGVIDYVPSGI